MHIEVDDLSSSAVAALLRVHLKAAALESPPESVHALDLEALRAPEITFWTAWEDAQLLGYRRLSLETGSPQAFGPARALYASFGFEVCPPFADYVLDPFSVFMTLALEPAPITRM